MNIKQKTIGIYRIRHVPTNSAYIGGSVYIENRFSNHKSSLKFGYHICKPVQELWDKTQPWEWEFEILEICCKEILNEREQHWMDSHDGPLLNVQPNAGTPKGGVRSEEFKAHMSEVMSEFYSSKAAKQWLSEKARKQHAQGRFGRTTWSKEAIESFNKKQKERGLLLRGKKHSAETRKKQSAAWTPERREAQAKRIVEITAKRYAEFRKRIGLK